MQKAKHALVPIAASPLHGGLLGSKRDHWRQTGRFAELYGKQERVEAVLARHGLEAVDTGLRYLLSDPRVAMVLSGVDGVAELERSVAVADGRQLDAEVIRQIEEA
ncbi:MAG: aldo/keto reductase [Candidatus Latescibacterota bacterium]